MQSHKQRSVLEGLRRKDYGRLEYRGVGEVAERSNATDCKSVGLVPSEVRILPSPPDFGLARESRNG